MKRTNYLLGFVFSVLIAISFTSCTEDPIIPVDNDPPLVSLLSGVDYISDNAQVDPNSNVRVKVKASVGTGDLKLLTIYENGDKLDLERIKDGINANPALLVGDDALGFEKEIVFASQADGESEYIFEVEDVNGLTDEISITFTLNPPDTDLNFSADSIVVGNFQGPSKGSIDLQTGTPVSSSSTDGDVQDIGWAEGSTDWAKRIKPKNGTEMVLPAAGLVYDNVNTLESLLEAYNGGAVAGESGDVGVGSIFLFKSPSSTSGQFDYFIMNTLVVQESPGDNNDYYVFTLKGYKN